MTIPRTIHQIWFQGINNISEKYLPNIKSIVDKNPNWEVKYWDENSIRQVVSALGEKYLKKYESFPLMLQKIDFGRYAILYSEGGISIDVDVFALKPLDEIPHINDSDFIVSNNSLNTFINNATILVKKNHPLIKELLDTIVDNNKSYKDNSLQIIQTTGPLAFTRFINKHRDEVTILDYSYLEPCSGMNKWCKIKENSILDHRHEGSWVNPFYKKLAQTNYFLLEHKKVIVIILIIVILIFILTRNKN